MNAEEIATKVREIIAQDLGVQLLSVRDTSSLRDDFNGDSLDLVELIMSLEDEFQIEIPDSVADENFKTVGDVIAYVCKCKSVEPVIAELPFDFRSLLIRRMGEIVRREGSLSTYRYSPVLIWLYKKTGGDPNTKRGRKEYPNMTLDMAKTLSDVDLIELFEVIVRCASRQM